MANVLVWVTLISVFAIIMSCEDCQVLVEKGQTTSLQCNFPSKAKSVNWKMLNGSTEVNLSTCFENTTCVDGGASSLYQGSISSSGDDRVVKLNVLRAKINETQFYCVDDTGNKVQKCELGVYAWPNKVTCEVYDGYSYYDYICKVDNIYPSVRAILHRKEKIMTAADYDLPNSYYVYGLYGYGTEGDIAVTCKWRIPINKMLPESHFYAEVSATVSNFSLINRAAVISNEITTILSKYQITTPSGSSTIISRLQPLIIIFGALCSGIISRYT